jgi:hypothetical protein
VANLLPLSGAECHFYGGAVMLAGYVRFFSTENGKSGCKKRRDVLYLKKDFLF